MGERTNASSSKYRRLYDNGTVAMITTLIFNVLLLLGVATCHPSRSDSLTTKRLRRDLIGPSGSIIWSTKSNGSQGKQYVFPYGSASTLPSDVSEAGTKVHAIPSVDSSAVPTYSPYHRDNHHRINIPPTEHSHQARTTIQPDFQGGFNPGQFQTVLNRVPQNNYKTNESPHQSHGNNQFRKKLSIGGSDKSQYFSNPSSYILNPESSKTQLNSSPYPGSTGSLSSFPKFKSSSPLSGLSDYSFGNPSRYRFPQATKYNSHFLPKHPVIPGNNIKLQAAPSRGNPEVSRYVKTFENEPLAWNTHQSNPPTSGLDYVHPKSHSGSIPTSFASNIRHYQPRVLPIESSRSTPEIPQYQAASVNESPVNLHRKPTDGYEQLANQPQFHFTTAETPNETVKDQPVVYHSAPFEEIRTDVELINKKKTTTPSPFESDEDDFGQAFKTAGDFRQSSARDDSFELPSSDLFDSYDQTFGKYSKLASLEQSTREENATSKPGSQNIEEENENDEDKSSGEYRSSYTDEKDPNSSYEDEGEEESQRNERHGPYEVNNDDDDDDDVDDDKTASYRSYGEDFEKEFEESYRKDLPKSDYVHVKEVPDIEESRSETKKHSVSRPKTKSTRNGSKQKTRLETLVDYEEPKNFESRTIHEYSNPRSNYRDNESRGSRASPKKTIDSGVEDSYGYKVPVDRETKVSTETNESDKTKRDQGTKKRPNLSQSHSDKISKIHASTQKPVTSTIPSIEELQSYTFAPFDGWKPSNKLVNDRDIYGATRQEVRAIFNSGNPDNHFSRAQPRGLPYLSSGQSIRDLTGI